jgi:hypothetical protein
LELIGYAASAFFISWVVSRATRWFLFKRVVGWRRAVLPNLIAFVLLTLLEALSAAGGSPKVLGALLLYGPSAVVLSLLDLIIMAARGRKPPQTTAG